MSYRCGIGEGFGVAASYPTIKCDFVGCDTRIVIEGRPPAWFLDGKAKRGWKLIRDGSQRRDYCPQHRPTDEAKP